MRVQIKWRFLLVLAGATVACFLAIHAVHRAQVRRQVGAFLHQADLARDATPPNAEREIAYLRRYLLARPAETDVRERLARQMCRSAKKWNEIVQAYLVVEDTLRRDPNRDEFRRFAIDFAMRPETGLYAEALPNIDALLAKRPNDGELEALKARCLVHAGKYKEAADWYGEAVKHRPDLVDAYAARAAILRREQKRNEEADGAVVSMLKANPNGFRAHLLVAEYWRLFGGLEQSAVVEAKAVFAAQNDVAVVLGSPQLKLEPNEKVGGAIAKAVAAAQKLAPHELDVILAGADVARFRSYELARAGERERAKGALAEAHRVLKDGLTKYPKSPEVYLALAALEAESKQEKEPVAVIRAGLEAVPGELKLTAALLDYQLRAGDTAGARVTHDELQKLGLSSARIELDDGRILMLQGKWIQAAAALDRVRRTAQNPALVREVNLFLGRCYEQLGALDRRLGAFRQAVPSDVTDPLWMPAMLGVAEAETALGKTDQAIQAFRLLQTRGLAVAWVRVAQLELLKALRTAADATSDWSATEEALTAAERALPKDPEVGILRATLLSLRGNTTEARKSLAALQAEAEGRKNVAVWVALATQDSREGSLERALQTLAAAEKELGDSPELRLAKARLWVDAKAPDLAQEFEGLATTAGFTEAQQRVLLRGLAELAAAVPGPLAARLWDHLSALQPDNLAVHMIRFELALRGAGDMEFKKKKLAEIQEELRRIDGEAGTSTRVAEVLKLLWLAENKEAADLGRATALLDGLERERAAVGWVAVAQARVDDLRGNTQSALAKYQKAFVAGPMPPSALRRLTALLYAAGKVDEAKVVLQKMPKESLADREGQRLAAEVSLRTNNYAQAEQYADRTVSDESTDPKEHLWRGYVYFGSGAKAKAEAAFRKAAHLRPDSPDGWLALIQCLALTNQRTEGERVLGEAREKVSQGERALFLGKALALLGQADKAAEEFKRATAKRPTDLRTLQTEADFLFRLGRLADAREAFTRVIKLQDASPEDKEFARRMLALCFAVDIDYATSRQALEALNLVKEDGGLRPLTGAETASERRSRILVLALQRDRASRLEAVRLLEADRDLPPDDQFLLAQLYQLVGKRDQVRVVMTGLLAKNDRIAVYVLFYAGWLLRAGDHATAEKWVARLGEIQPDALSTAELRARLAVAKGDLAAARAAIVPRADAPDAPVLAIAQVCESIKLFQDAETLYKKAVEKEKDKQPQAPLVLAGFYGRQRRTAEALEIVEQVRTSVPAAVAGGSAVQILYDSPAPAAKDVARVAEWLDKAAQQATREQQSVLFQLLAAVRNLQGDYAESMNLYRKALKINERDALAMNNLAFLLSAKDGNHAGALDFVAQAKKASGQLPELLDTEALVRLRMKDIAGARRLLDEVTAQAPSGPGYFHLAQVELAAGRRLEAQVAWREAEKLGVKPADLHPLERPEFERVSALLK